jgi:hypothetical protein
VVVAGVVGSLLLLVARPAHPHSYFLAVAIVVAVTAIVQLASPWEPGSALPASPHRGGSGGATPANLGRDNKDLRYA